jgi:hypothetical protein
VCPQSPDMAVSRVRLCGGSRVGAVYSPAEAYSDIVCFASALSLAKGWQPLQPDLMKLHVCQADSRVSAPTNH